MTRLVSFGVLLAIIVVIGALFYKVMIGFFVPIFLAAVLVVVFRPLHQWVLERVGFRNRLAAALTTLTILFCVLAPSAGLLATAAAQGTSLITGMNSTKVNLALIRVRRSLGMEMEHGSEMRAVEAAITRMRERVDAAANKPRDPASDRSIRTSVTTVLESMRLLRTELTPAESTRTQTRYEELIKHVNDLATLDPDWAGPDLQEKALEIEEGYKELKVLSLGGATRALVKDLANPTDEELKATLNQVLEYVRPKVLSFTTATGLLLLKVILGVCIMIVALYFFFADGAGMIKAIMELSPLDDRYEQELLLEFDRISRAVVVATLASAIAQGTVAGIAYYFLDLQPLILLVLLTTLFALVPFFGPATVWVPLVGYLVLYEERLWAGVFLALWGVLLVGTIDNVVKAAVLHGRSQLHPLLAFLSVLGGVQALGPIGIVVGPMVVVLLQTLLGILRRELVHLETDPAAAAVGGAGGVIGGDGATDTIQPNIPPKGSISLLSKVKLNIAGKFNKPEGPMSSDMSPSGHKMETPATPETLPNEIKKESPSSSSSRKRRR